MKEGGTKLAAVFGAWLLCGGLRAAFAEVPAFDRYQAIIDRKPFGIAPLVTSTGAAGRAGMAAPAGSFIVNLRMCAVTERDDDGLRVGIVDIKSNKSYLFRIGETQDEITLVDADYLEECALLRKGNEEYWISLKGEATAGSGPGAAITPPTAGSAVGSFVRESYAERLKKRREAIREKAVDVPQMTEEQLQKHLNQYQMELIRAGGEKGPPLPIQLTPEMDAQLVSEGVLPPAQ